MKKLVSLLFVVICFTGILCQVDIIWAEGAGSSAGITLIQPVSAKATSMAEAYTSLSGDIGTLHYNPAGILPLEKQEASFMYQQGLSDDDFAALLYGRKCTFGTLGASILYYDTGNIEMYNTDGDLVSDVGQKDIVLAFGIAREIAQLPVGVMVKYISSEIFGKSANAVALDVGTQLQEVVKGVDVGLAIRNAGTKLKYISEEESLPLVVQVGGSYERDLFGNMLLVAVDIPYYVNEKEMLTLLGLQYTYKGLVALRGGYRLNLSESDAEDETINVGFGILFRNYRLDYAMGITEDLDIPHRISLSAKF